MTIRLAALSFVLVAAAAPTLAQQNDRKLIIYGNDRCPEGTICVRAPESERFRIPQSLRDNPLPPDDQPWRDRASMASRAGSASGIGSCSPVGAGGFTGCQQQMMKQARDENRADSAARGASAVPH